jgi:hypothetical protein
VVPRDAGGRLLSCPVSAPATTSLPTPTSVPFFFFLSSAGEPFFHLFVLFFSHALLTAFVSLALALARSQVVVDTIDDLESADVC